MSTYYEAPSMETKKSRWKRNVKRYWILITATVLLIVEGWDRGNLIVIGLAYFGLDDLDHSVFIIPCIFFLAATFWAGRLFVIKRKKAQEYAESTIEAFCSEMDRTFGTPDEVVREGVLQNDHRDKMHKQLEKLHNNKNDKIRSAGYDFLSSVSLQGPRYCIIILLFSVTFTSASARLIWDSYVSIESQAPSQWISQKAPNLSPQMSKGDFEQISKIVAYAKDLSVDEKIRIGQSREMSRYVNKYNGIYIDAKWDKISHGCERQGCVNTMINISKTDGSINKSLSLDCSQWSQLQ